MHRKQTLQRLAKQDNLFLKESITTAEDEHTAMAKANKTEVRQNTIDKAHNQNIAKPKASITQLTQNTTYGVCTAFKRAATQILTNKKQVTFGETYSKNVQVHFPKESGKVQFQTNSPRRDSPQEESGKVQFQTNSLRRDSLQEDSPLRESKNVQVHFPTKSGLENANTVHLKYDSGADGHYVSEDNKKEACMPILRSSNKKVGVANGDTCKAKNVTRLPFPQLSKRATTADTFTNFPTLLMSVGKTSNDGTISIFTKTGVTVHKETDVLIRCKGAPLLIGVRDKHGRYCIPLIQKRGQWQPRTPSKKARHPLEKANSVYHLPSTEQGIKWMHAVCRYPVKSTWLKAIAEGNFIGWPLLNVQNVKKYYPETTETPKVHMNQTRKNVRLTKVFETSNGTPLKGKKFRDIGIHVYNVRETIFLDQTGKFPKRSQRGYKYIMVMVKIDSNAILVEPMKSRKDEEMIQAYDALLARLRQAGSTPQKHVLDNEVSDNMKHHIQVTCKLIMELVPPECHRRNAAEVAI